MAERSQTDAGSACALRPGVAVLVIATCTLAFAYLASHVSTTGALAALDLQIARWLHANASPALVTAMFWVSNAQGIAGISVLSLLMGAFLARKREWNWLLVLILSVAGGMLLNVLLKETIRRPRPMFDDPLLTLATWSFPSGHTAGATAFYGVVAAYLTSNTMSRRRRTLVIASAITLLVLVAFSRMVLGAHYLSDVLAAFVSSTGWLALCFAVVGLWGRHRLTRA
ncbi:phosphatase PAP2 family protein [Gemmatimonas groenlandica]|uniref:Phosphatase PAP2 family protein n=1 Tax=Gemmatimonas groenlandica TaxID=2732249 RepID=A0A6M4IYB3_9BACT|nr:phosphatase PAP2 family protein [Gemmatimonas groenlandica]QJR37872.1 phosphatase PAP2 family protein [Gemmatimonas groenlandica]